MIKKIIIILIAIILLFPFFYVLLGSFFTASDFATSPHKFLPSEFNFNNYEKILNHKYFPTYIFNSSITALLSAIGKIAIAFIAAFAFNYYNFKYSSLLFTFLLLSMFIPSDLLLVQNYITIQSFGLIDTFSAIILPNLLSSSVLLMLYNYFKSVPKSIFESAKLDGVKDRQYIFYILLPLSNAVVVALAFHTFINVFNSYLWPLLVTNTTKMRTIQVGLTMLGYSETLNYGPLFAGIFIITLPFIILFIVYKKRLVKILSTNNMYI